MGIKPPPYNANAERALMSCIALAPSTVGAEVVDEFGKDIPFYDHEVAKIYYVWATGDRSDFSSIDALDRVQNIYPGFSGEAFRKIVFNEPHTVHYKRHLEKVKECFYKRKLLTYVGNSYNMLYDSSKTVAEVVSYIMQGVKEAQSTKELDSDIRQKVKEDIMREKRGGLSTGQKQIDELIGPLQPGEVTIVAARTSVGKSTFIDNVIRHLSVYDNHHGAVFCMEMPAAKCVGKIAASIAHVNSREVAHMYDEGYEEVVSAYDKAMTDRIHWDERMGLTMDQVESKIRKLHAQYGIAYAVLDHLGCVSITGRNIAQERGNDIKRYKAVCKELGIVPFIVMQINRAAVEADGGPQLHHLKETGAAEEDTSNAILLHRDVTLSPEQEERVRRGKPIPLKAAVAKARYGSTGVRTLAMFLHSGLIQDKFIEDEEIDDGQTK
jgi:replicative DNA helicase